MSTPTVHRLAFTMCLAALATTPACGLLPYPNGAITCTPGRVPCPDGYACLDPKGSEQNTCIEIGCGDGQVDSASAIEQCDDANANDLDLCVECKQRSYAADLSSMVGFGPGAADASITPLGRPIAIASSADGILFVSSLITNVITRLDLSSEPPRLTSFVGNGSLVSVETANATPPNEVSTVFAVSLAVDGLGNLFIGDLQNSVIRRIDAVTGAAETVAGNGIGAPGEDDVVGNQTSILLPRTLAVDGDGTLFFTDQDLEDTRRIRRLDRVTGRLTTVPLASLTESRDVYVPPDGLAFDEVGALYILSTGESSRIDDGVTATTSTFLRVTKVTFSGAAAVPVSSVLVPISVQRFVAGIPEGRREQPCFAPDVSQKHHIAVSRDGRRLFFPAGRRFMQVDLQPDPSQGAAPICTVLGQAPVGAAGPLVTALNLSVSGAAVVGDDVFFADGGNGVVWRVRPDAPAQSPEVAAGVLRPQAQDPLIVLTNELLLEFAEQSDGHVGFGVGTECNNTGAFDLSSFELLSALPEAHRVLLSECGDFTRVLAGNGTRGFAGDGSQALNARLSRPAGAVRGPDGHFYIADRDNDRIRRVRPSIDGGESQEIIETFIGPAGSDDSAPVAPGDAGQLLLARPSGLALDSGPADDDVDGRLLISDSGTHRILRVDMTTGEVVPVMGTGEAGFNGDTLPAAESQLDEPSALVFLPFSLLQVPLPGGLLVIAERGGHRIRATVLPPSPLVPEVFTLAGDGEAGDRDDAVDGRNARFFHPRGLMFVPPSDDEETLRFFVIDAVDRVRELTVSVDLSAGFQINSAVTTLSASLDGVGAPSRDDGARDSALFRSPSAVAVLGEDSLLVVDRLTGRLRLVTPSVGTVRTLSGMPDAVVPGTTPVPAFEAAPLNEPAGLAIDVGVDPPAVFVSEAATGRLRRFTLFDPGDPASWTTDALANVQLTRPAGLAVDTAGRVLYVADQGAHVVYGIDLDVIDVDGTDLDADDPKYVVAGVPGRRGATGDGPADEALLNEPEGVTVFENGRVLLIADSGNNRVRRVDLDGDANGKAPVIFTILGDRDPASGGEGSPASAFPVLRPRSLAVDSAGNLLVTSTNAIRFVQAGDDRLPDGTDDVRTIYGKPPREVFPESVTRCLSALALAPGSSSDVYVVDACLGVLIRLQRR
jgi:sugar lactone lactonase YvrE